MTASGPSDPPQHVSLQDARLVGIEQPHRSVRREERMDVGGFHARRLGVQQVLEVSERILAGPAQLGDEDPAPFAEGLGVGYQPLPLDVGGEMVEVRVGEFPAQVIAHSTGRVDAHVARVHGRHRFDELGFGWFSRAGAGDGPTAHAAPALVPLAELIPVPSPGHIAEVRPLIADNVDVGPFPAHQPLDYAGGAGGVLVVLLDENVVRRVRIGRAAILRMHVAPTRSLNHKLDRSLVDVEDHHSKRRTLGVSVAQEAGQSQPLPVGGYGRERVDPAGSELRTRQCRIHHHDRLPVAAVEVDSFERQAATSRLGAVDEVVEILTVRRDRRPGGSQFLRQRVQSAAVVDIAQQVLVFGVVLAAAVRMGRTVQNEPFRVHREDLCFHVDVGAGHVRLGGELDDFNPLGRFPIQQIRPKRDLRLAAQGSQPQRGTWKRPSTGPTARQSARRHQGRRAEKGAPAAKRRLLRPSSYHSVFLLGLASVGWARAVFRLAHLDRCPACFLNELPIHTIGGSVALVNFRADDSFAVRPPLQPGPP